MKYTYKLNALAMLMAMLSITSLSLNAQTLGAKQKSNGFVQTPGAISEPNTVVIKLKQNFRGACSDTRIDLPAFNSIAASLGVNSITRPYRLSKGGSLVLAGSEGKDYVDLSLIYKIKYSGQLEVAKAIDMFNASGLAVYAEPSYMYKHCYTPNDTLRASRQAYLNVIGAYQAWDITKGDTNIVIGIVDSGIDWDHPDMVNNIKLNYLDPINGIDDDNDGFIDNYRGWDVGGADYNTIVGDNNPMVMGTNNTHGSHVAGCASAATDNITGVSGVGFNTKLLGVKCAADNDFRGPGGEGYIISGYEGITYAADHGCRIINCSWGGPGFSQQGQDIINYALNNNAIVVCAAGNDNSSTDFYPSGFKGVISVAASSNSDARASFSNYNPSVAVMAPGVNIYSTYWNDTYASLSGTSMASPVVAGCMALILAKHPNLNAATMRAWLQSTSTDVYGVGSNGNFKGQLGRGRINIGKAVGNLTPSINLSNFTVQDSASSFIQPGSTVYFYGKYRNLLNTSTSSLKVRLVSTDPYVTVLKDTFLLGSMAMGDSAQQFNIQDAFKLKVATNMPSNYIVYLKLVYTDSSYTDAQYVTVPLNNTYINITPNNISTTITSIGRLGYNGDAQTDGIGFQWKKRNLAYEIGLVMGTSPTVITNTIRGVITGTNNVVDKDYFTLSRVAPLPALPSVAFSASCAYSDASAPSSAKLRVRTTERTLAYTTPADSNYIIKEYILKNTTTGIISNIYLGLFADWDISLNGATDKCSYNYPTQLGYCFDAAKTYAAGIQSLSPNNVSYYATNNDGTNGGLGVNLTTGFSRAEKFRGISTGGLNHTTAGNFSGNDISMIMSQGPFTLAPGDTIVIPFAVHGAKDSVMLKASAVAAAAKYNVVLGLSATTKPNAKVLIAYPNPAATTLQLGYNTQTLGADKDVSGFKAVTITSIDGKTLISVPTVNIGQSIDISTLPSGLYFINANAAGSNLVHRIQFVKL